MHLLTIKREHYTARTTSGRLCINGEEFCFTLEDTVRPVGIKVKDETALPGGTEECPERYVVKVTHSRRFNRLMVILSNTDIVWLIKFDKVEFRGSRMHGGNRHKNTKSCPLVAYKRVDWDTIQGTAEKELTEKVMGLLKEGAVYCDIINLPQKE